MFSISRRLPSLISNLNQHLSPSSQSHQSKCWVSLMKIGGQGDPFKTTIQRKNQVIDPSKPKYLMNEKEECLKWATWHTFKDVKKRYIAREYYPTRVCLLQLFKYKTLPFELRDHAVNIIRFEFPRKSRWRTTHVRYHCILTGRIRGRVMRFKVSRFMFRHLADYNKLSGVIKGKWSSNLE